MRTMMIAASAIALLACGAVGRAQEPSQPPADVLEAMREAGGFVTFLQAVETAGVTDKLEGPGPFTVFAPTDEAFARLPDGMLEDLMRPANRAQLAGLLGNHVVPGRLTSANFETMKATNVNGRDLHIRHIVGVTTVSGSRVVRPDLAADNGVVHGVKLVLRTTEPVERAPRGPLDHPAH